MYKNKFLIKENQVRTSNQVWMFDKDNQKEEILVKAVVENGGRIELKDLIKIEKNVKGVEAFLKYKVLLLGENASAVVEPQLEIESNEVKASHAASVGRIDEEKIFYLQSRGFSKEEAEKLIVEAFLK